MKHKTDFKVCEGILVPESALLKRKRSNRYGSVPGLDDSELAGPDELERQVMRQEFEPLLTLPVRPGKSSITANTDGGAGIDWGAFGTVDFDRYKPQFDKFRYKADIVREQLKDLLIVYSIVNDRIGTRAKYMVLKYLRMGIIELEHIVSNDMLSLARLHLRARKMRQDVTELHQASWRRQERKTEALCP